MKEFSLVKHISLPELCSIHGGIMQRFPIWNRVWETLSCGRSWKTFHVANTKGCLASNVFAICTIYWSLNQIMHKRQVTFMSLKNGVNTMKCWEDLKHFMLLQSTPSFQKSGFGSPHFSLSQPPAPCRGAYGGKEWKDNSLLLSLWSKPLSRPISSFTSRDGFFVGLETGFFSGQKKNNFSRKTQKENGWNRKEKIELGSGALSENEW